uniref:Uncharacterized protein n=1 Tax=Oryza brachyantha TaxID=4533 RepID=J3N997_ORYBR
MGAEDEEERRMHQGCMAGFLHLFDRPQILSGKRLPHQPRRLLSSSSVAGTGRWWWYGTARRHPPWKISMEDLAQLSSSQFKLCTFPSPGFQGGERSEMSPSRSGYCDKIAEI